MHNQLTIGKKPKTSTASQNINLDMKPLHKMTMIGMMKIDVKINNLNIL